MVTKQELGVNGEHTALGREFSMHEFKGFMVAKIDSMEKRMNNFEMSCNSNEKRIGALENFRIYLVAFAAGAVFVGMAVWEAVKLRIGMP